MINRLNSLLSKYQNMCYTLYSRYSPCRGMYGELGHTNYVSTIRNTFLSRTRATFRIIRRSTDIANAYTEIRILLKHPVAQELEMMSESARKET